MDLVSYVKENAKKIEDDFILEEIGKDALVIGLDAITLEHFLDGFIRNKIEVDKLVIPLIPTDNDELYEELHCDALDQGLYVYPKAVAVAVELIEEAGEMPSVHIKLDPFYTVQALEFFDTLPEGDFADDDLVTTYCGDGSEVTSIILQYLLDAVPELSGVAKGPMEDVEVVAEFLSRTFGVPIETQGYLSTDEEGVPTLALFSVPANLY